MIGLLYRRFYKNTILQTLYLALPHTEYKLQVLESSLAQGHQSAQTSTEVCFTYMCAWDF